MKKLFDFIEEHIDDDTGRLMLSMHGCALPFSLDFAVTQIEARRKTARKLSNFTRYREFLFPSLLSAEQASHQAVARFHASLTEGCGNVADITAGLGIDAMTIASAAAHVDAFELERTKVETLRSNANTMGVADKLTIHEGDSIKALASSDANYDIIFCDPARRDSHSRRTYAFADCIPDIIEGMPVIMSRCRKLIVKSSPLLDAVQIRREIPGISTIMAVGVKGECKEMLAIVDPGEGFSGYEAVDLDNDGNVLHRDRFNTDRSSAKVGFVTETDLEYGFIYEPSAMVMKFSPWKELVARFPGLRKLAPNTHLFHGTVLHADFPGRILRIEHILDKKDIKEMKGMKINVATRNHPLSATALRDRLGLKDGGDMFLYGATAGKKPVLLLCSRP